jgi:ABC-2 type transport system permease protein
VVFVGVIALFPVQDVPEDFLPSYGDYYGFIIAAIMVFVALVAPEVLCTDRRSGMLGVYLSSPLDRDTYLLAKAGAIVGVVSLVCLGPPLLMLVANVLQSQGPEGWGDIVLTLLRVLGAGVALSLLYTGVTMGVASMTDRKSVASAGIILLFLVSITVTQIITGTGGPLSARVGSVTLLSLDLATRIHGERSFALRGVSSAVVWGAWFAWTVGGFALARYNIKRLPVTR